MVQICRCIIRVNFTIRAIQVQSFPAPRHHYPIRSICITWFRSLQASTRRKRVSTHSLKVNSHAYTLFNFSLIFARHSRIECDANVKWKYSCLRLHFMFAKMFTSSSQILITSHSQRCSNIHFTIAHRLFTLHLYMHEYSLTFAHRHLHLPIDMHIHFTFAHA